MSNVNFQSAGETFVLGGLTVGNSINTQDLEAAGISSASLVTINELTVAQELSVAGNIVGQPLGGTFVVSRPNSPIGSTPTSFVGQMSLLGNGGNLNVNGAGSLSIEAGSGSNAGLVYIGTSAQEVRIASTQGTTVRGDVVVDGAASVNGGIALGSATNADDFYVGRPVSETDGYDTYITASNAAGTSNLTLSGGQSTAAGNGNGFVVLGITGPAVSIGNNAGTTNVAGDLFTTGDAEIQRDLNVQEFGINGNNLVVGNDFSDFYLSRTINVGSGANTIINGQSAPLGGGNVNFYAGDAGTSGRGGDLIVSGNTITSTFASSVQIESNSVNVARNGGSASLSSTDVLGDFSARKSAVFGNGLINGDLSVKSEATLGSLSVQELNVANSASVANALNVAGSTSIGGNLIASDLSAENLMVAKNAGFAGSMDVAGTTYARESATVAGGLNVAGNTLARNGAQVSGDLAVAGSANFAGELSALNLNTQNLAVSGAADVLEARISGSLNATEIEAEVVRAAGAVTADRLTVSSASFVRGGLTSSNVTTIGEVSTGTATLSGALSAQTVEAVILDAQTATVGGKLSSGRHQTQTLTVAGRTDLVNVVSTGVAALTTTLEVSEKSRVGSATAPVVRANDVSVLGSFTAESVTVRSDAEIGRAIFRSGSNVTNNLEVFGNLQTTAAASATVGGRIDVDGDIVASETNANLLFVEGLATISGDLNAASVSAGRYLAVTGSSNFENFSGRNSTSFQNAQIGNGIDTYNAQVNELSITGSVNIRDLTAGDLATSLTVGDITFSDDVSFFNNIDIEFRSEGSSVLQGQNGPTGGNLVINAGRNGGNLQAFGANQLNINGGSGSQAGSVFINGENFEVGATTTVAIGSESAAFVVFESNTDLTGTSIEGALNLQGAAAVSNLDSAAVSFDSLSVSGTLTSNDTTTVTGVARIENVEANSASLLSARARNVNTTNAAVATFNANSLSAESNIDSTTLVVNGALLASDVMTGDFASEGLLSAEGSLVAASLSANNARVRSLYVNSGDFVVSNSTAPAIVDGDLYLSGSDLQASSAIVNNDVTTQALSLAGNTNIAGNLRVSGTSSFATVTSNGVTNLNNDLSVASLSVEQDLIADSLTAISGLAAESLTVGDTLRVADLSASGVTNIRDLSVNGSTTVANSGLFAGSVNAGSINANQVQVSGSATLSTVSAANINVAGQTSVSGDLSSTGPLFVGGRVAAASASATANSTLGDLAVAGTTVVSGDLATDSYAEFRRLISGPSNIDELVVGGNQGVDGTVRAVTLESQTTTTIMGGLSVMSNPLIQGDASLTGAVVLDRLFAGSTLQVGLDATFGAQFNISRGVSVEQNLFVNGVSNFDQLSIAGVVASSGSANFSGDAEFLGDVTSSGALSASAVAASSIELAGELTSGNTSAQSASLSDLSVGALSVGCGGANINGALILDSSLDVATDVSVGGSQSLTGNLNSSGSAVLNFLSVNGVTRVGRVFFTGELNSAGAVVFTNFTPAGAVTAGQFSADEVRSENAQLGVLAVSGNFSSLGNSIFEGPVNVQSLEVGGAAAFAGSASATNVDSNGDALLGDLRVTGIARVAGNLTISGMTTLTGANSVQSISVSTLDASDLGVSLITVSGQANLRNVGVSGNSSFGGDAAFTGLNTGNVTVSGRAIIQSGELIGGTTALYGNFENIQVDAATAVNGPTNILQTADVAGSVFVGRLLGSKAVTAGSATISGVSQFENAQILGDSSVAGDLFVGDRAQLGCTNVIVGANIDTRGLSSDNALFANGDLTTGGLSVAGPLLVTGSISSSIIEIAGSVQALAAPTITSNSAIIGGDAETESVSATTFVSAGSLVGGAINATSVSIQGPSAIQDNLSAADSITVGRTLDVNRDASANNIAVAGFTFTTNVRTTGQLNVGRVITAGLLNAQTINVSGDASVTGLASNIAVFNSESLEVDSFTTANLFAENLAAVSVENEGNTAVTGEALIGQDATVEGVATISGSLNVAGASRFASAAVTGLFSVIPSNTTGSTSGLAALSLESGSFSESSTVNDDITVGRQTTVVGSVTASNTASLQSAAFNGPSTVNGPTRIEGAFVNRGRPATVSGTVTSQNFNAQSVSAAAVEASTASPIITDRLIANQSQFESGIISGNLYAVENSVNDLTAGSIRTTDVNSLNIAVYGPTRIVGDLSVSGPSNIGCSGTVEVAGILSVGGALSLQDVQVRGQATGASALVSGDTVLNRGLTADSADFSSSLSVSGNVDVADASFDSNVNAAGFVVSDSANVESAFLAAALGQNLAVNDSLSAAAAQLRSAEISGDTNVANNAQFDGTFSVDGPLTVSENAAASSVDSISLNVAGSVAAGSASVSGPLTVSSIEAESAQANTTTATVVARVGTLEAYGAESTISNVTISGNIVVQDSSLIDGSLALMRNLEVTDTLLAQTGFSVDRDTIVGGETSIGGTFVVTGDLMSSGRIIANSGVSVAIFNLVDGVLTAPALRAGQASVENLSTTVLAEAQSVIAPNGAEIGSSESATITVVNAEASSLVVDNVLDASSLAVSGSFSTSDASIINLSVDQRALLGATNVENATATTLNVGGLTTVTNFNSRGDITLGCDGDVSITGAFSVSGPTSVSGDASIAGDFAPRDLFVGGQSSVAGLDAQTLSASSVSVNDALSVSGSVRSASLQVEGTLNSAATSVSGAFTAGSLAATELRVGSLSVDGSSTISSLNAASAAIQGSSTFNSSVVSGAVNANGFSRFANLNAGQDMYIQGDALVTGDISIGGGEFFNMRPDVDTTNLNVSGDITADRLFVENNVEVGGDVAATGGIEFSGCTSTLSVQGAFSARDSATFGDASVNGDVIISRDLTVLGTSTVDSLQVNSGASVGTILLLSDLTVDGASNFASDFTVGGSIAARVILNSGDTDVVEFSVNGINADGRIGVDGDIFLGAGSVSVAGDVSVAEEFTTTQDLLITGDMTVDQSFTVDTNVNIVGGANVAGVLVAEDVSAQFAQTGGIEAGSGTLSAASVAGDASLNGDLAVTTNALLAGGATITEPVTFNAAVTLDECNLLSVSGSLNLAQTLTVGGNLTAARDVAITGDLITTNFFANSVSSAALIANTDVVLSGPASADALIVSGSADLTGSSVVFNSILNVNGDTTINGPVNVRRNAQVSGELSVAGSATAATSVASDIQYSVRGTSSVAGRFFNDGDLTVDGFTSLGNNVQVSEGSFVGGTLEVVQNVIISSSVSLDENLYIAGSISSSGNIATNELVVFGNEGASVDIAGDLDVVENGFFLGGITAASLSVAGPAAAAGDVNVGGQLIFTNPANSAAVTTGSFFSTSDVTIGGDQTLTSAFIVSREFSTTGSVSVGGDTILPQADVTVAGVYGAEGDISVGSFMIVLGSAVVGSSQAGQINDLSVLGAVTVGTDFNTGSTVNVASDFVVDGSVTVDGSLFAQDVDSVESFITQDTTVVGDLLVQFSTTVTGSASVAGSALFGGSLTVGDAGVPASEFDSLFAGSLSLGTLTVAGSTTVNTELTVSGNMQVSGPLGLTSSSSVFIGTDLTVGTSVSIGGAITAGTGEFGSSLTVQGSSTMTGNLTTGNDLTVNGEGTVRGNLIILNGTTFIMPATARRASISNLELRGAGVESLAMHEEIDIKRGVDGLVLVAGTVINDEASVGELAFDAMTSANVEVLETATYGHVKSSSHIKLESVAAKHAVLSHGSIQSLSAETIRSADLTVADIEAPTVTVGRDLFVTGPSFFTADSQPTTMIVNNASGLSIATHAGIHRDLITEIAHFSKNVVVQGKTLLGEVHTASAQVASLAVSQNATFTGKSLYKSDLTVNGTLTVEKNIVFETSTNSFGLGRFQEVTVAQSVSAPVLNVTDSVNSKSVAAQGAFGVDNGFKVHFASEAEEAQNLYAVKLSGYTLNFLEPGRREVRVYRFETMFVDVNGGMGYRYEVGDVVFVVGPKEAGKSVKILDWEEARSEGKEGNVFNGRSSAMVKAGRFTEELKGGEIVMYMYSPRSQMTGQESPVEWVKVQ
eukprot:TRINITY_DN1120_c0_g1_i2.p1 TRINITY_DN1120_c0_g1~~TRINITY_DN1120_c0_g1_i2.p1  ORF type:complete len:4518 (-),score=1169.84 TRINITY_DN1120_c0_g1_i2:41-12142(-)